jgi:hypothetical protein
MMRNTDVRQFMTQVETALLRDAGSPGHGGPIFVTPEDGGNIDIARLRHQADIDIELPSGSDRPVVGPVIVFTKRVVRRGLRWYLQPIMRQQSLFNHAVLDAFQRSHLENEKLRGELEALRHPGERETGPLSSEPLRQR